MPHYAKTSQNPRIVIDRSRGNSILIDGHMVNSVADKSIRNTRTQFWYFPLIFLVLKIATCAKTDYIKYDGKQISVGA
jgi:hypothetical protein